MKFTMFLDDVSIECDADELRTVIQDLERAEAAVRSIPNIKEIVTWISMEVGDAEFPGEQRMAISEEGFISEGRTLTFRVFMDRRGYVYFEDLECNYCSASISKNRLLDTIRLGCLDEEIHVERRS